MLIEQRILEKILDGHKSFCPRLLFVAWSTCNPHTCVCIYCLSKMFLNMYLSVFSVIFVNNFAFGPQVDHHVSVVEGYLVILVILRSFPDPQSRTGVSLCQIVWKWHAVNAVKMSSLQDILQQDVFMKPTTLQKRKHFHGIFYTRTLNLQVYLV